MTRAKKKIAYIFLVIYGIVFAHNIIPHHHHSEHMNGGSLNLCASSVETVEHSHHHHYNQTEHDCVSTKGHHCHELYFANHQHPPHEHHACYFEVRPVVKDSNAQVYIHVISLINEFMVPLEEPPTISYAYCPQKLLESYNFAVPLRAPPIFS